MTNPTNPRAGGVSDIDGLLNALKGASKSSSPSTNPALFLIAPALSVDHFSTGPATTRQASEAFGGPAYAAAWRMADNISRSGGAVAILDAHWGVLLPGVPVRVCTLRPFQGTAASLTGLIGYEHGSLRAWAELVVDTLSDEFKLPGLRDCCVFAPTMPAVLRIELDAVLDQARWIERSLLFDGMGEEEAAETADLFVATKGGA